MTPSADSRIPLSVVTGFLGSGKTTFIRRLISDPHYRNATIIVNELGETGIDHHLFRHAEERITLLRDGCACCARRDDLVNALTDLLRHHDRGEPPPLERVVLETTGLADPAPILHTLVADPLLSRRFRLETTIATLDAVAGENSLAAYGEAVRQITAANVVAITKGDLANPQTIACLRNRVAQINPVALVLVAEHGAVEIGNIIGAPSWATGADSARTGISLPPPLLHTGANHVGSASLTFDEPLEWPMLGLWLTMLLHRHGERVLRVKGLLDVGDRGPLLLEGVQHVVHRPRHLPAWPDDDHHSRLVFITRDLEPALLTESLHTFQALARPT